MDGIEFSGSSVYVGGSYSNLGGMFRGSGLGSTDMSTGVVTAWNPAPNSIAPQLAVSGTTLYVGGAFTTIAGQGRNGIAAFDVSTNSLNMTWNPNAGGGPVNALAVGPTWVYAGGSFTFMSGDPTKRNFAAISLASGAATYTWQGAAGADWQVAGNWTPSRTTPAANDILQFNAGTHTPTNIPTQTIGQLSIAAGATVSLRGSATNTLTVNGNMTIPPSARLDLAWDGTPTNPITLSMGAGFGCTVQGTLNVSTASIVGTATSNFTLSAGATLMTARDDGINGTAAGNGSVQGFALANITYDAGANYVLKTEAAVDVPMNTGNAGGTKPPIPTMNNLTIWSNAALPARARNSVAVQAGCRTV
ncbi:MAG: hypothetical protein EAZ92_00945 [Candidatus Kapaibacterium sp.]|nr:MAG: hypothetical protein EAZ92_00945 [Candidatus Kapabacteria bacterium]